MKEILPTLSRLVKRFGDTTALKEFRAAKRVIVAANAVEIARAVTVLKPEYRKTFIDECRKYQDSMSALWKVTEKRKGKR
jgi:hypothetical protein